MATVSRRRRWTWKHERADLRRSPSRGAKSGRTRTGSPVPAQATLPPPPRTTQDQPPQEEPGQPMHTRRIPGRSISRCPTTCSSRPSHGASPTDPREEGTISSPLPTMAPHPTITRSTGAGPQAASRKSQTQHQHQCQAPRRTASTRPRELFNSNNSFPLHHIHTRTLPPLRRSSVPLACLSRGLGLALGQQPSMQK